MRRDLPLVGLLLLLLPVLGAAQTAAEPAGDKPDEEKPAAAQPGAETLVAAGTAATPAQLWRDTRILWLPSRLSLTADQARVLVTFLTQLQTQITENEAKRAQLWQEKSQAISAVLNAWIAGQEPEAVAKLSADDAADQSAALDTAEATALQSTLGAVLQTLSDSQKGLIETAQEARQRKALEERLEGAPSVADFVLRHIQTQRALMPDEYVLLRAAEASRVAARIVGRDSDQYEQARSLLLRMFDQISNWTDEQFAAALPDLPGRIREYLQLTDDQPARAIREEELSDWVRDARTGKYLAIYGTAGQPLAPDPEPKPDELRQALQKARIISLINDLQLNDQQLAQLQTLVTAAKQEADKAELEKIALLAGAAPDLSKAIPYLITGKQLDEQWTTYLSTLAAKLKEQDDALNAAMIPLVASLRRVLAPLQERLVDWRVPPRIVGCASPEARAEQAQEDAAMVEDAMQLIEGLRPLIQTLYLQLRIARIEEFLAQYVPKGSPNFERLRDDIADQITEARGLTPEQWEQQGPEIAVEVLNTAGQLLDDDWVPSDRPLDWYVMRDLLLDPQTGPVLQQMLGQG